MLEGLTTISLLCVCVCICQKEKQKKARKKKRKVNHHLCFNIKFGEYRVKGRFDFRLFPTPKQLKKYQSKYELIIILHVTYLGRHKKGVSIAVHSSLLLIFFRQILDAYHPHPHLLSLIHSFYHYYYYYYYYYCNYYYYY